ncbi:MBOAT family O-acyltransferase [Hwanghaeella sp.]|uniref:MBOAT family O-acyltransferase n=1 Tax=Hwanghaeella sp. TaxID=2605943 RepID=UPI003CCBBC0F
MLFHSQEFLLLFLPVALIGWYAAAGRKELRVAWMIVASLAFYAYWDLRLLPLLGLSILGNWGLAALAYGGDGRAWMQRVAAPLGITLNLFVLGVFKYADFMADSIAWLIAQPHEPWGIVLPLGISFFTFQQISYLADLRKGKAPVYGLADYALYVSFFPQLIAGPIVRHDELIHQFDAYPNRDGLSERLMRGAALLLIGVSKKVLLADVFAAQADPIFAHVEAGNAIGFVDAWAGAGAFGLQIYFDFSAYSDMAIGLAMMAGIRLPENFNAPYRAVSLVDFWRRWHMTLSRFLRDYLYFSLGGNRAGRVRQALALTATMLLGGLWHGAAWTFVIWGGLHGIGLVVSHFWGKTGISIGRPLSWAATMLFVFWTWVMFRAESMSGAMALWTAMLGLPGGDGAAPINFADLSGAGWLLAGAVIAALGPTSQSAVFTYLRPVRGLATAAALLAVFLVFRLGGGTNQEFIYFQF